MALNSRTTVTVLVVFVGLLVHLSSAAVWRGHGCPAGKKVGDKWSEATCSECTCYENDFFTCVSCGVAVLARRQDCYVDYENRAAKYPSCCIITYFCKGDPDFDNQKFLDYWKNDRVVG